MRYFLERFKKNHLGLAFQFGLTPDPLLILGHTYLIHLFRLDRLRVGRSISNEKQKKTQTQRWLGCCMGVWISLSVLKLHTKYSSDVIEENKKGKNYVQCNIFLSQFLYHKQQCKFYYKEASRRFRVDVIVNKLVGKCSYVVLINYLWEEALVLFCPEGVTLIKDCWYSVTFPTGALYSFP